MAIVFLKSDRPLFWEFIFWWVVELEDPIIFAY